MINRHSRKILKRSVHNIIIFSNTYNTWIRAKSRKNRVLNHVFAPLSVSFYKINLKHILSISYLNFFVHTLFQKDVFYRSNQKRTAKFHVFCNPFPIFTYLTAENLILTITFLPVFPAILADTLVSFLPAHLPYSMPVYSS